MSTALNKIMARLQPAPSVESLGVTKLASVGAQAEYIEKLASALEYAADAGISQNTATTYVQQRPHTTNPDGLASRLREKIAFKQEQTKQQEQGETKSALERIIGRLNPAPNDTVSDRIVEVQEVDDPLETVIAEAAAEAAPAAVVEHVQQVAAIPSASLADVLQAATSAAVEAKGTSDSASSAAADSAESVEDRAIESAQTASASGKGPVTVASGSASIKAALAARRLSGGKK